MMTLKRLILKGTGRPGRSKNGRRQGAERFCHWAAKKYPADRYVLILSDHGTGWRAVGRSGDVESKPKILIRWVERYALSE
jgi:hypothetical protein